MFWKTAIIPLESPSKRTYECLWKIASLMAWKSACVSPRVGWKEGKRFKWANKIPSNSFLPTTAMMMAWGLNV